MPGTETNRDAEILRRLRELGAQWREETGATSRQLSELQLLLRQTVGELDRLTPRGKQATQRVSDMEAHIDSYSRGDIKEIYAAAQEAQMRLFMMQLQQEQIEHKRRVLTAYHEALSQVVALAERVTLHDDGAQVKQAEAQPQVSPQDSMARVIHAQEDERRRVARQIHDGPAQGLANIVLRAEICERLMDKDQELVRRELPNLKKLVTDSLRETRHFIFDLRPMILDDLGLAPTLRRYCEMLSESGGVPVRLRVSGSERRLGPAMEIALFRVVQEAVRNALRHGQPGEVQVALEMEAQTVRATVQDDGRGCDGEAAMAAARQGRTAGLAQMDGYVRSVTGDFSFESAPAQGCSVAVVVPLTQQET